MTRLRYPGIRTIVFDLDGTLYVCPAFAATIQDRAAEYIAGLNGVTCTHARELMAATRARLTAERGIAQTLTNVCTALGGDVRELHAHFTASLTPEAYLRADERVVELITRLNGSFPLYIYTNNNRAVTDRILALLGLKGLFREVFSIDDVWRPKPDEEMLERILASAGVSPREALFVGDRYEVDLVLPERYGCPVYLTQSVEHLMRLGELLPEG